MKTTKSLRTAGQNMGQDSIDSEVKERVEKYLDHPPQEFSFPVERGKIEEFADALLDTNDIFRDEEVAKEEGYDNIPAPLTFVETNRFERMRIPEYEPDEFFDEQLALHGAQEYEVNDVPEAGDTLHATRQLEEYFFKEGGSGEMLFGIFRTDYRNQDDELLITTRKTRIITGVDDE